MQAEHTSTRKASFAAAKMFMPFDANSEKKGFFMPKTRNIKIREAEHIFEAFDEDSSGTIGKDEMLAIMDYLDITEDRVKRAIRLIFGAEHEGFKVDKHVFNLWLRNVELMQRPLNTSERVYFLLEDVSSCGLAAFISFFMLFLILASVVALMCESLKGYNRPPCYGCEPELADPTFDTLEVFAVAIFTIEYGLRLICVPFINSLNQSVVTSNVQRFLKFQVNVKKPAELLVEAKNAPMAMKLTRWAWKPMNVIDLLAIAPFYAELVLKAAMTSTENGATGGADLMVLRVLRLGRLFRVIKLQKYSSGVKVFARTVIQSAPALSVLVFVLLLMIILFGQLLFLAEGGVWYRPEEVCNSDGETCYDLGHVNGTYLRQDVNGDLGTSPFKNAFDASWCILATMTTVSTMHRGVYWRL
jgi:hypothetical protein